MSTWGVESLQRSRCAGGFDLGAVVGLVLAVGGLDPVVNGAAVHHFHQPPLGVVGVGDGLGGLGREGGSEGQGKKGDEEFLHNSLSS